jgi:hypothetical protein
MATFARWCFLHRRAVLALWLASWSAATAANPPETVLFHTATKSFQIFCSWISKRIIRAASN